jgi:hypothetical protein
MHFPIEIMQGRILTVFLLTFIIIMNYLEGIKLKT